MTKRNIEDEMYTTDICSHIMTGATKVGPPSTDAKKHAAAKGFARALVFFRLGTDDLRKEGNGQEHELVKVERLYRDSRKIEDKVLEFVDRCIAELNEGGVTA